MGAPEVSVVVPTFRRPRLLTRCLTALARQDAPPDGFEVVVVDDGSGDSTGEVVTAAARGAEVRLETLPVNSGPAAARNRGIEAARGGLILFLDDDVEATPTLVSTHRRLHAESGDDRHRGILGLVRWAPDLRVTPFMRWLDRSGHQFAYDTWLRPGPVAPPYGAFYTANLSMRRSLLVEVGGFDRRFPHASFEDLELAWRLSGAGLRLEYRPEALAYHVRPVDLATFRRRTANDAESAALLRAIQPGYPLDDGPRRGGFLGRRWRIPLGVLARVAGPLGARRIRERWYQAEIAAAYQHGMLRAAGAGPDVN